MLLGVDGGADDAALASAGGEETQPSEIGAGGASARRRVGRVRCEQDAHCAGSGPAGAPFLLGEKLLHFLVGEILNFGQQRVVFGGVGRGELIDFDLPRQFSEREVGRVDVVDRQLDSECVFYAHDQQNGEQGV